MRAVATVYSYITSLLQEPRMGEGKLCHAQLLLVPDAPGETSISPFLSTLSNGREVPQDRIGETFKKRPSNDLIRC
jgi:hypothetical protein